METKVVVLTEPELEALIDRAVNKVLGNGAGASDKSDRLLNPEQAAAMLNVTPRWLYRHANQLPFTRRLSRKALRFSETGLLRYRDSRKLTLTY